nr:hypothetical protein [uncultured Oscillibacter sp.]
MNNLPNNNDTVILELDRPRELRLGHKALKRFSSMTGCSMEKMESAVNNYETMSTLIYVMLSQEDKELTPERVDDLLDDVPIGEIVGKCSQAITAAFVGPGEPAVEAGSQEKAEGPPTSPGTGETASALQLPLESPFVNGNV